LPEDQLAAVHDLPGAQAFIEWFGSWPSFHDAEILSISLNRTGTWCVRVQTWEVTSDVDAKGYDVAPKHVIVSLLLEDISDLKLGGFSHQNVIFSLTVTRLQDGLQLCLGPGYGLASNLTARSIRVEFAPGKPDQTGVSL
jgi:hypothetical protein